MFDTYSMVLIGLWVIIVMISIQAQIATFAHRRQKKMIPGIMDPNLGHESFIFRSDRTFRNSLDNIIPLFGLSMIAIMSGFSPDRLASVVWVYALARLGHMILYYCIATERNPSPRTYFYTVGLVSTWYLSVDLGIYLVF